jgi:cytochrome P450
MPTRSMFGAFVDLAGDPLAFMGRAPSHGPLVRVRIGRETLIFVAEPELIHSVLVGRASELLKDQITQKLNETLGNGLLTSEGDFWRRQRRLMAPLFNRSHLASYGATMAERTLSATTAWRDGETYEIHHEMMTLTLDILLRTVFGAEMQGDDAAAIGGAIEQMMDTFEKELRTWRRFVPSAWLVLNRRRMTQARRTLNGVVSRLIDEKRAAGAGGDDVVSRLLAARSDDGSAMSDQQVRDEAVTMVDAGHETTALVMTFSARLLDQHAEARDRLHAELDGVLGGRQPGLDDLPRLPFARAVVLETMRLYPPAYIIGRQVQAPMALGGCQLLAGDQLLVPIWHLHHSAQWFDAPEAFRPERWLDGLAERLPEHAYMPFGGGPRICIGQHFAMMEAVLCLAALHQGWRLAGLPHQSEELSPAVTLRPRHGWRARVHARALADAAGTTAAAGGS